MEEKNYFSYSELTQTSTNMFNDVTCPQHAHNLSCLWRHLNRIRTEFGNPIYVNSAYRTAEVNEAVGGVENSYHLQGRAADIRARNDEMTDKLYELMKRYQFIFKEFIKYPHFIHFAI